MQVSHSVTLVLSEGPLGVGEGEGEVPRHQGDEEEEGHH